jgi:hypothetical protein
METGLQTTTKPSEAELIQHTPDESSFSMGGFEHAQRVAKMLSQSNLIPETYRGNIQNTMIALEMATRIGASPIMVMQNLYIVQGKPSWSSSFIIASLNASKRFSPLRFKMEGTGPEYGCTAWAYDLATKDKLEGPKVTMAMATAEQWVSKSGSKWRTMPELMFRYRAAAFFGRLYAPDILMGMQTAEEVFDVQSPGRAELIGLPEAIEQMKGAQSDEDFMIITESFPDLVETREFQKNLAYFQRKNTAKIPANGE